MRVYTYRHGKWRHIGVRGLGCVMLARKPNLSSFFAIGLGRQIRQHWTRTSYLFFRRWGVFTMGW